MLIWKGLVNIMFPNPENKMLCVKCNAEWDKKNLCPSCGEGSFCDGFTLIAFCSIKNPPPLKYAGKWIIT